MIVNIKNTDSIFIYMQLNIISFDTKPFQLLTYPIQSVQVQYLLTAVGLSPGGSTHLHTNYIEQHK
jgi:hypothetical protein